MQKKGSKEGNKSEEMVFVREERSVCEAKVDERSVEHVSEAKYLWFVLDELGIDRMECCRRVKEVGRQSVRSALNSRSSQLECARINM